MQMSMSVSPDSAFDAATVRKSFRRMTIQEDDSSDPFGLSPARRCRAPSPRRNERETVDTSGNTPLIQAVISGSKIAVERCIQRGAEVDSQNYQGQTALFVACASRRADIAEALLRRGADANIAALDGSCPLHAAAANDDERLIGLLLDYGAFANARDDEGEAPLHWAAREGSRRAAALLLRRGADPALSNEDGETAYDVDPSVLMFGSLPAELSAVPQSSSLPSSATRGPAGSIKSPQPMLGASLQQQKMQPLPSLFNYATSAPCSLLSAAIQQQQQQQPQQQSPSPYQFQGALGMMQRPIAGSPSTASPFS